MCLTSGGMENPNDHSSGYSGHGSSGDNYCAKCGRRLNDGDQYCGNCGKRRN